MPEGDRATVERIIANTINETARGDPDALAARIELLPADAEQLQSNDLGAAAAPPSLLWVWGVGSKRPSSASDATAALHRL